MKRFFTSTLLIALVAGLSLVGCSSDDDNAMNSTNNAPAIPAEVVDVWVYSSVTVNGASASLSSVLDWTSGAAAATFEIAADGTFWYFEFDSALNTLYWEKGTVKVNGTTVTVTTTQENGAAVTPYSYTGTWQVSGSTMTLRLTLNGDSIVLTAVK